jgi:hypothetical protein
MYERNKDRIVYRESSSYELKEATEEDSERYREAGSTRDEV